MGDKQPKDDKNGEPKVPPGFEKFLKRSKREESSKEEENKEPKKEEQAASQQKPEEDKSDTEENKEEKKHEQPKEKTWYEEIWRQNKEIFMKPDGGGPNYLGWFMIAASIAAIAKQVYLNGKASTEINFQDLVNNHLTKNTVELITLSENRDNSAFKYRATIKLTDGSTYHMVMPQIENFLYKLDQSQRDLGKDPASFVPVKYGPGIEEMDNKNRLLFTMIFFGLFFWLYRASHPKGGAKGSHGKKPNQGSGFGGGGGGLGEMMNMSKSNAQVFGVDKKMRTRFKHVAGMQNAKTEVLEFVDFLKNPEKYKKLGAKIPRGALLTGPPGTGKTLLAKAVAGEAGVPFLSISGSDFVQMYVGVGAGRVRDLFKQARSMAPAIIFIDEIDAVAKKRDQKFSSNDERDNTLNQLLVEMDGFSTDESVIILAATNLADSLDPAIKRPGRFDRQIQINLPTIDERREIYNVHLKKIKCDKEYVRDEYATKLSALTPGFSGADIANICNEGAIIAARGDQGSVTLKNFEMATERVLGGIEKKLVMSPLERKTVAYHEAGHAVAGWFLEHSNPLLKITIIPRAKGSLGFAQYLPEEINLYAREQLIDMICVALGGRISEEITFGKITTGAGDDIKKVTQIAQSLIGVYGMSRLGLISLQQESGYQKAISDETNFEIDQEVKSIVDECYARTKTLLEEKKDLVAALAEELLAKESINLPAIIKILGERPFPMKESLKQYLQELNVREDQEAQREAKEKTEREAEEAKAKEEQTEPNAAEPASEDPNKDK